MPMVVIRHLIGQRPAVLAVIEESKHRDVDDQHHYCQSVADDEIQRFKEQFVEFQNAEFYCDYIKPSSVK